MCESHSGMMWFEDMKYRVIDDNDVSLRIMHSIVISNHERKNTHLFLDFCCIQLLTLKEKKISKNNVIFNFNLQKN